MAERTCVVCRRTGNKNELVRFVSGLLNRNLSSDSQHLRQSSVKIGSLNKENVDYPPGQECKSKVQLGLMIDLTYCLPGRGAYCHEEAACLLSKQVLGKLCYSLEVGSAKRKKLQSDKLTVSFSLKDLLSEAKERYLVNDKSDKKHFIEQKLSSLEKWVETEYDRVKDLRHKRRVRL